MPYANREKQLAAQRKWYQDNKELQRARNGYTKRSMFEYVKQAKSGPCVDCKQTYPYYVMQFDHIGTDKVERVSWLVRHSNLEAVQEEIAKCELVCANCHAIRTWSRYPKNQESH